jgi:hypothetical protein
VVRDGGVSGSVNKPALVPPTILKLLSSERAETELLLPVRSEYEHQRQLG